jgi:hypothetical protein
MHNKSIHMLTDLFKCPIHDFVVPTANLDGGNVTYESSLEWGQHLQDVKRELLGVLGEESSRRATFEQEMVKLTLQSLEEMKSIRRDILRLKFRPAKRRHPYRLKI